MILLDPSHIKRKSLEYSTFYLPCPAEYTEMFDELYTYSLGGFDDTKDYWTSKGGGSGGTYAYYSAGWSYADNQSNDTLFISRPVRYFDYSNNTTYPIRTLMSSSGYIFHIADNGDGTYRHYEAAPSDIAAQMWSNELSLLINPTGNTIGAGLANSQYIVGRAGHTTSAANDCLNHTL